jgi:pimeloyl-ACP methyl ester carboxylesterase
MQQTIETRELFELDAIDGVVRGTYHKAHNESSLPLSDLTEERIGVVFLNSLTPTRAATGDSAVYWAESFAELGYPSFRFDPPGFGDSDGEPPTELLNFVNAGGYASISSASITELARRFRLSGVVTVGLCAGAVSALYTAAASKECRGVVLMDPYFFVPVVTGLNRWQELQRKFTNRMSRNARGRQIISIYDRLTSFKKFLPGNSLPPSANVPLLNCWKSVSSAGMPILLLKAPHTNLKVGEFDYLNYILETAGPRSRVQVKVVEDTGHSFANRVGRAAVRETTENWLRVCFPLEKHGEFAGNAPPSEFNADTGHSRAAKIVSVAKIFSGV